MDGCGLSNTVPKKTKLMLYYSQKEAKLVTRWSTSVINVNGHMHSNAFKRRLGLASASH